MTPRSGGGAARRLQLALAALAALVVLATLVGPSGDSAAARPLSGLRVEVLDVGQGDAILLQPAAAPAILVDGGPPGDELAGKLEDAGVERLGAVVVTHDQSDHIGGIEELLGRFPSPGSSTRAWDASRWRRPGPPAPSRCGSSPAPSCARAASAWRCSGRRASCWPGLCPARPEPAGAGPARPLARLLDAAERRRRGGGGAARPRPGRRAQGRPPRQRRRRPRGAARPHRPRAWR